MKKIAMAAVLVAGLLATVSSSSVQAQTKLGPAAPVTYDNRYELYGGLNFMNFMAGRDLTRRMDFGGGEIEGTFWLTRNWGLAAEYRGEAGTTPVWPTAGTYGIHRPLVYMNMVLFGAQYRWVKNQHAALDFHAYGGPSFGVFDAGTAGSPAGKSANHPRAERSADRTLRQPHRSDLRAGRQRGHEPLQELGGSALARSGPGRVRARGRASSLPSPEESSTGFP